MSGTPSERAAVTSASGSGFKGNFRLLYTNGECIGRRALPTDRRQSIRPTTDVAGFAIDKGMEHFHRVGHRCCPFKRLACSRVSRRLVSVVRSVRAVSAVLR